MSTLFLLPESRLSKSPSAQDNLSPEDEYDLRILGCEFIQSSGLLLKLPQTAMATAQVLFHRFYYSKSFVRYSYQHTAMACVVLASKTEEAPKRIRDVIRGFQHLNQLRKNEPITELLINDKYVKLKNEVVKAERRILKELGFCVYVNHPHKFIVSLLKILDSDDNRKFVQTSWSYMNDGLRTDVFLRYSPETIACSCVYLSARILEIPLPESPAWWEIFSVTESDIRTVCKMILKLYTRSKPDQERLEGVIEKLKRQTERSRSNIIKQLTKSAVVESPPPLPPSQPQASVTDNHHHQHHVKKIKVDHIIHRSDSKRPKKYEDDSESYHSSKSDKSYSRKTIHLPNRYQKSSRLSRRMS